MLFTLIVGKRHSKRYLKYHTNLILEATSPPRDFSSAVEELQGQVTGADRVQALVEVSSGDGCADSSVSLDWTSTTDPMSFT